MQGVWRQSWAGALAVSLALGGCTKKDEQAQRIHLGTPVVKAFVRELFPAPGGRYVATLAEIAPSKELGAPQDVYQGALTVAPVAGGAERRLGGGVTNLPGNTQYSADGQYLAFLAGFSVTRAMGELRLTKTAGGDVDALADKVTFFAFSPANDRLAYVADGELFLKPLAAGAAPVSITRGVQLVEFGPKGTAAEGKLLVKRSIKSGGALLSYDLAAGKLTAIARGVGAFGYSPSGDMLAFQAQGLLKPAETAVEDKLSGTKARAGDAPGLYLQQLGAAPKLVASEGASEFKFSPKGGRIAFVAPPKGTSHGDLFLVDPGGEPQKIAPRVSAMQFADDGTLALLGAYESRSNAGTLGVVPPEGKLQEVARNVLLFQITPKGRFVLYSQGTIKNGVYTVALAAHRVGAPPEEKPRQLDTGVFGFVVDKDERHLAYKSRCVDQGKACTLFVADLVNPGEPVQVAQRVAAFEFVPDADGLVVITSRHAGKLTGQILFSLAVANSQSNAPLRTIDDDVMGEFALVGPDKRRIAYLVNERGREGLYLADVDIPAAVASPK